MAWPNSAVSTANLDSGGDSPALARADLLALAQAVNQMMTERLPAAQAGMPSGALVPFAGSASPTGWLMCDGSAVSRTTYADLFAAIGTTYGAGDGSTTFSLPDMRGRVAAGRDNMGGTAANRLQVTLTGTTTAGSAVVTGLSSVTGLSVGMVAIGANLPAGVTVLSIDTASNQVTLSTSTGVATGTASIRFGALDGATLGAAGGAQSHTLTAPQMPAHTHTMTGFTNRNTSSGGSEMIVSTGGGSTWTSTVAGGGQAHPNVQPTMVLNYIIKT